MSIAVLYLHFSATAYRSVVLETLPRLCYLLASGPEANLKESNLQKAFWIQACWAIIFPLSYLVLGGMEGGRDVNSGDIEIIE